MFFVSTGNIHVVWSLVLRLPLLVWLVMAALRNLVHQQTSMEGDWDNALTKELKYEAIWRIDLLLDCAGSIRLNVSTKWLSNGSLAMQPGSSQASANKGQNWAVKKQHLDEEAIPLLSHGFKIFILLTKPPEQQGQSISTPSRSISDAGRVFKEGVFLGCTHTRQSLLCWAQLIP